MVNLINANAQLGSFVPIMLSNLAIGNQAFLTVYFLRPLKKILSVKSKEARD